MPTYPSDTSEVIQDHSEDQQLVIEMYEERLGRPLTPEELLKISTMFNSEVGEDPFLSTE